MTKCGKEVTHTYVWNGEVHFACPEHTQKLEGLCIHMSWPLTVSLVRTGKHKCEHVVDDGD